jgi:hypothetical protein
MDGRSPFRTFVQLLPAIVAVGVNASGHLARPGIPRAGAAQPRAARDQDARRPRREPASVLLLVTGVANAFIGGIPRTTPWIRGALVRWGLLIAAGGGV